MTRRAIPAEPVPLFESIRLRELVDRSNLTQAEVAARAETWPANLSNVLSGKTVPRIDLVARILWACGLSWADLDPD